MKALDGLLHRKKMETSLYIASTIRTLAITIIQEILMKKLSWLLMAGKMKVLVGILYQMLLMTKNCHYSDNIIQTQLVQDLTTTQLMLKRMTS